MQYIYIYIYIYILCTSLLLNNIFVFVDMYVCVCIQFFFCHVYARRHRHHRSRALCNNANDRGPDTISISLSIINDISESSMPMRLSSRSLLCGFLLAARISPRVNCHYISRAQQPFLSTLRRDNRHSLRTGIHRGTRKGHVTQQILSFKSDRAAMIIRLMGRSRD